MMLDTDFLQSPELHEAIEKAGLPQHLYSYLDRHAWKDDSHLLLPCVVADRLVSHFINWLADCRQACFPQLRLMTYGLWEVVIESALHNIPETTFHAPTLLQALTKAVNAKEENDAID